MNIEQIRRCKVLCDEMRSLGMDEDICKVVIGNLIINTEVLIRQEVVKKNEVGIEWGVVQ